MFFARGLFTVRNFFMQSCEFAERRAMLLPCRMLEYTALRQEKRAVGFFIRLPFFNIRENKFFTLKGVPTADHSHSMVAGGLDVMSYTIRLAWSTSLMMREEIFSKTS